MIAQKRLAEAARKSLAERGGFEVGIAWKNGKLTEAALLQKRGGACKIIYGQKVLELKTEARKSYRLDGAVDAQAVIAQGRKHQ